jgi:hypothetical protein
MAIVGGTGGRSSGSGYIPSSGSTTRYAPSTRPRKSSKTVRLTDRGVAWTKTRQGSDWLTDQGWYQKNGQIQQSSPLRQAAREDRRDQRDYGPLGAQLAYNASMNAISGDLAYNDLASQKLKSDFLVNNGMREIDFKQNDTSLERTRINQAAADRQKKFLKDIYDLQTQGRGMDRMDLGIADRANDRIFGLVNAEKQDTTKDLQRLEQALGREKQQNISTEEKNRLDAATDAIGQGMMGSKAQGNVVFGREELGRQMADNAAQMDAGRQQYAASMRKLDEQLAKATDQRDINKIQRARYDLAQKQSERELQNSVSEQEDQRRFAALDQMYQQLERNKIGLGAQYDFNEMSYGQSQNFAKNLGLIEQSRTAAQQSLPYYTEQAKRQNPPKRRKSKKKSK